MASRKHQGELDILQDIRDSMQEFTQQNKNQFREVFHLIEGLTTDVHALKRHANISTSPTQRNPRVNTDRDLARSRIPFRTEDVESMNPHQGACVNEEFKMQEVLPDIEGIMPYSIVFALCSKFKLIFSQMCKAY